MAAAAAWRKRSIRHGSGINGGTKRGVAREMARNERHQSIEISAHQKAAYDINAS